MGMARSDAIFPHLLLPAIDDAVTSSIREGGLPAAFLDVKFCSDSPPIQAGNL